MEERRTEYYSITQWVKDTSCVYPTEYSRTLREFQYKTDAETYLDKATAEFEETAKDLISRGFQSCVEFEDGVIVSYFDTKEYEYDRPEMEVKPLY
jgi:hypothetical protein